MNKKDLQDKILNFLTQRDMQLHAGQLYGLSLRMSDVMLDSLIEEWNEIIREEI